MKVYNQEEAKLNPEKLAYDIGKGAIFVYPTDTIYGIGCNAMDDKSVQKIREIKGRPNMPFSVIAPNKEWIYENCEVGETAKSWIEEKLPGPYTFILKLNNYDAISKHVTKGIDTIGIRIPDHWCSEVVSRLNTPLITTSANISGHTFMTSLENMHPHIKAHINFALCEGELNGRQSKIVDFSQKDIKIKER